MAACRSGRRSFRCSMPSTPTIIRAALCAALFVALLSQASAQDAAPTDAEPPAHGAHSEDMGSEDAAGGSTAAARAYDEVNARMHRDMAVALSGDPDRDFAEMMIAHHQGAIDMARVVMEHGRDPEIRALAEEVVATQEREVAFLRDWLARTVGDARSGGGTEGD